MSEWKETEIGILPEEWDVVNIGSLIEEKGIAVGVMYPGDFTIGGVPLLRAGDINTGKIDKNINYQISNKTNEMHKRTVLHGGELLVVLVGNPGVSVVVSDYFIGWNVARAIGVLKLKDKKNGPYISYSLLHPGVRNLLLTSCNTTVQPTLNLKELKDIIIPWPTSSLRNTIASILSSLDDKIDLLHRQNATLEAMAETLFKQWFVEEAKEDWEEGTLGEVIEIFDNMRVPLSKMERDKKKDGRLYPYYGAAQIMDYINDYIFDGEYILLGEDGTVRTSEGFPVLQYATGKFWVNNHTHVIQAKLPYNNFFVWNYLRKMNIDEIITGAVQPKINQGNLKSLAFPKFPKKLVLEFNDLSGSFFKKINQNKTQIHTLTALRDTLLPKLMSGEVRVEM